MSNENREKSLVKNFKNGKKVSLKPKQLHPNTWNGVGIVESDLQLRKTSDEDGSKSVLNFTLKVKQPYKVRNQETKQQEEKFKYLSFPVTAWDIVAENMFNQIKKNDLVKVNGYIRTFFIKTRNTKNVLSFEIVCNRFNSMVKKNRPDRIKHTTANAQDDRTRIKQD